MAGLRIQDQTVSVIMPALDEGHHICANLLETVKLFERAKCDFEIIVIDDGSTDDTRDEVAKACAIDGRIKGVFLRRNYGKGHALQVGFQHCRGDYVVFLDSDLDLHPRQLVGLFRVMRDKDADVVAGSKRHPESTIDYPFRRKVISWIYYYILWMLFNLPLHDTQAGLKIFRRRALRETLPFLLCKRYALDVELLANVHHLGFRICEAPVKLKFRREHKWGRIRFRDLYYTGLDTLAIFYRIHILRYYDRVRASELEPETAVPALLPVAVPDVEGVVAGYASTALSSSEQPVAIAE